MDVFPFGAYAFEIVAAANAPVGWIIGWGDDLPNQLSLDERLRLQQAAKALAEQRHPNRGGVVRIVRGPRPSGEPPDRGG